MLNTEQEQEILTTDNDRGEKRQEQLSEWKQHVLEITMTRDKSWNPIHALRGSQRRYHNHYEQALEELLQENQEVQAIAGPKGGRGWIGRKVSE